MRRLGALGGIGICVSAHEETHCRGDTVVIRGHRDIGIETAGHQQQELESGQGRRVTSGAMGQYLLQVLSVRIEAPAPLLEIRLKVLRRGLGRSGQHAGDGQCRRMRGLPKQFPRNSVQLSVQLRVQGTPCRVRQSRRGQFRQPIPDDGLKQPGLLLLKCA